MVAHIAGLLGALAPAHTTSVRVRGYLAQLGLALDEYGHLQRYAEEAFGPEVPIRVHRCTQVAHNTLDRLAIDLELEGVREDWRPAGVRRGALDTRLPDRLWERSTHSSRQGGDQPVRPRPRMARPPGSGKGQQQHEAARETLDHTGDLAMASAGLAMVDVAEETEDIL